MSINEVPAGCVESVPVQTRDERELKLWEVVIGRYSDDVDSVIAAYTHEDAVALVKAQIGEDDYRTSDYRVVEARGDTWEELIGIDAESEKQQPLYRILVQDLAQGRRPPMYVAWFNL